MSKKSSVGDALAMAAGVVSVIALLGMVLVWEVILPVVGLLYLMGYVGR